MKWRSASRGSLSPRWTLPRLKLAERKVCSIRVRSTRVRHALKIALASCILLVTISLTPFSSCFWICFSESVSIVSCGWLLCCVSFGLYVRRLSRPSDLLIFSPSSRSRSFCNSLGTPLTLRS